MSLESPLVFAEKGCDLSYLISYVHFYFPIDDDRGLLPNWTQPRKSLEELSLRTSSNHRI
jgi:hypothetical protein